MELHPFVRYAARSGNLPNRFMTVAYDCRCLYILGGRGRLYFEDAEYPLEPGTLAVYPAGKAYMPLSEEGDPMEFISVNFDYTEEFSGNTITMSPVPAERVEPERVQRTQLPFDPRKVDERKQQFQQGLGNHRHEELLQGQIGKVRDIGAVRGFPFRRNHIDQAFFTLDSLFVKAAIGDLRIQHARIGLGKIIRLDRVQFADKCKANKQHIREQQHPRKFGCNPAANTPCGGIRTFFGPRHPCFFRSRTHARST